MSKVRVRLALSVVLFGLAAASALRSDPPKPVGDN